MTRWLTAEPVLILAFDANRLPPVAATVTTKKRLIARASPSKLPMILGLASSMSSLLEDTAPLEESYSLGGGKYSKYCSPWSATGAEREEDDADVDADAGGK